MPTTNLKREIALLDEMTVTDLKRRYAEVFGEESRSGNKDFLRKRLAWRFQALAEGDLSERARQRAEELANDADLRVRPPRAPVAPPAPERTTTRRLPVHNSRRLMPGTILSRPYKGRTVTVTVVNDGFECAGESYRSLSAVAKAVTGAHWNGNHFFGLVEGGSSR
jgi:hypothetical protein